MTRFNLGGFYPEKRGDHCGDEADIGEVSGVVVMGEADLVPHLSPSWGWEAYS